MTSENTSKFRDVVYLVIADLDESPDNVFVRECPESTERSKCPHHLVQGTVKIVKDYIDQINEGKQPETLQKVKENAQTFTQGLKDIMVTLTEIKSEILALKKTKLIKPT